MGLNIHLPKLKLKFKKMKMDSFDDIKDVKIDYEKLAYDNLKKRRNTPYEHNNFKTVKEFFYLNIKKFATEDCILEKPDHKEPYKTYTYKEFGLDVRAFGTSLIKLLNQKDKRIIIVGETQYGWYLSYMACLCGAGIAVPVDRELPDDELINVIERSKATTIIYSDKKADSISKIRKKIEKQVEYFVEMRSDKPLEGKDVGVNYLIKQGKKILKSGDTTFDKIEIDPEEFKVLIFTSGTTSNSKGVMVCNRNLAENVNACDAYVQIYPSDMLFSVLPLHHTYESTIGFLYPISKGASIAICEGLRYIVPNIQEVHPTAILVVPLLIEAIYKKINDTIKKSRKTQVVGTMMHVTNLMKSVGVDVKRKAFKEIYDNLGGKLRIVVSAAAPLDKKVGEWFQNLGVTFLQGYGLTETCPIAALTPDYKPSIGSVGKAIVSADIKTDSSDGKSEGEILIKSPTLMLGYYENSKATEEAMTPDGYFRSGDIGYIDDQGFIFITGRSKNVIVTQNGKNIYPEEIEQYLTKIPEISEVMVYGKQDEKDDKELIITALIKPNYNLLKDEKGQPLSEEAVKENIWPKIKEVNRKLTNYKAIKLIEIKNDDFEKTSTMKIKRYKEMEKTKNKNDKTKKRQ